MGRVLVAGSYNASFTIFSEALPTRGQTILGQKLDMGPGGKGNNQAIAARRLGAEVVFAVKVGNDIFGAEARELFKKEGLPPQAVHEGEGTTGIALILVDSRGDNLISVAPGTNAQLGLSDVVRGLDGFSDVTHVLCQLECSIDLVEDLSEWARVTGRHFTLNPAPAHALSETVYANIDVITPNETELATLTGLEIISEESAEVAARRLLDRGVKVVLVTLGAKGALLVTPTLTQPFDAYPADAVDTTGCGDAFNGAFVAAMASGANMSNSIDLALRAGAFCATHHGVVAGLPTRSQLDAEVPFKPVRTASI
jgi:ribokinase